ncbi:MAG: MipA/OmpV family protein [Gammaproteobacteria bacterium]|nr:MipA/OmpV family protein [Gammaproteobacteria bacterium]
MRGHPGFRRYRATALELGLGAGAMSFPPWPGSSHRNEFVAPAPYVVCRGERFLADRSGLRALLFDSDTVSLRLSLQASPPPDDDGDIAREGMDGLDPVAEFGPEVRWRLWQADARDLQLQLRLPLRSAWEREQQRRGLDRLCIEALDLHHNGWKFGLGAGPVFGTADYHDYFYGVAPRHATPSRPAYDAEAGFGGMLSNDADAAQGQTLGRVVPARELAGGRDVRGQPAGSIPHRPDRRRGFRVGVRHVEDAQDTRIED